MTALVFLSETISGPPESPWHESFPPLCRVYKSDSKSLYTYTFIHLIPSWPAWVETKCLVHVALLKLSEEEVYLHI